MSAESSDKPRPRFHSQLTVSFPAIRIVAEAPLMSSKSNSFTTPCFLFSLYMAKRLWANQRLSKFSFCSCGKRGV